MSQGMSTIMRDNQNPEENVKWILPQSFQKKPALPTPQFWSSVL